VDTGWRGEKNQRDKTRSKRESCPGLFWKGLKRWKGERGEACVLAKVERSEVQNQSYAEQGVGNQGSLVRGRAEICLYFV